VVARDSRVAPGAVARGFILPGGRHARSLSAWRGVGRTDAARRGWTVVVARLRPSVRGREENLPRMWRQIRLSIAAGLRSGRPWRIHRLCRGQSSPDAENPACGPPEPADRRGRAPPARRLPVERRICHVCGGRSASRSRPACGEVDRGGFTAYFAVNPPRMPRPGFRAARAGATGRDAHPPSPRRPRSARLGTTRRAGRHAATHHQPPRPDNR